MLSFAGLLKGFGHRRFYSLIPGWSIIHQDLQMEFRLSIPPPVGLPPADPFQCAVIAQFSMSLKNMESADTRGENSSLVIEVFGIRLKTMPEEEGTRKDPAI
jgi:hypothetical protein